MRVIPFIACLLAFVSLNAAAQTTPPADELSSFLQEKGLLARIGEAGNQVTTQASDLVVGAMGFLGVPYRRGGSTVETGFDCSGFVKSMYEQTIGLVLPRSAAQQAAATQTIERTELRPGDLVFFNTMRRAFSHVGIYVGNGKFIHSPKPGAEVRVEDMGLAYWARRFDGARRVSADASPAKSP
jgi:cell wall-associated NlpC family hydrolase